VDIQDLNTLVFTAGRAHMVAQMQGAAIFARGKPSLLQREVRPAVVPMTSIGAHSYYHGFKAYTILKNLQIG